MELTLLAPENIPWEVISESADSLVFQTKPWIDFLAQTRKVIPFVVEVRTGEETAGWFVGGIFSKFGLKIIGAPFEGWTTSYQGFCSARPLGREERVRIYRALSEFCLEKAVFFQFQDWNLDFEDIGAACNGTLWTVGQSESYLLDISPDIGSLFRSFKQKSCQYSINKARRCGVTVREPENMVTFAREYYAQLRDVFAKQGLKPTYGLDTVLSLLLKLGRGNRTILEALHPETGCCIATIIFVHHNSVAFYWGAASYREHQRYCPNELLMFEAIKRLKSLGIRTLEMEGIRPYKEKYNPLRYAKPKVMASRHPVLYKMKDLARTILRTIKTH